MKNRFIAILLSIAALCMTITAAPITGGAAEPDLENDYTLLDWQPIGGVYWNAKDANNPTALTVNGKYASQFVSSAKMFTQEEIPAGSIIEIDAGYQYRPEGWERLELQQVRADNVSLPRVIVDEAWWGSYTYRAFNISLISGAKISDKSEEVRSHFRIYVPKDTTAPTVAPSETPTVEPSAQPTAKPAMTPVPVGSSLKILAIGNSFSEDAMKHLYNIAAALGYEDVVLGNMFIGGGTLAQHRQYAEDNTSYTLQKIVKGVRTNYTRSLKNGIQNEAWDFITLQQGSGSSGLAETYGDLDWLVDYIKTNKTNPDARIGWHMTWAYQQDSTHNEFGKYNRDQLTMYHGILNAVQTKVLANPDIDFVIPAGTAVQNMRTSYVGDTLTRDGYHMSYNLGRYIVGLTWFKTIIGQPIDTITWLPDDSQGAAFPASYLPAVIEAVNNACANQYEITPSSYPPGSIPTPKPEVDYSRYKRLDLELVASAYWNPTHNQFYNELITKEKEPAKDNFKQYISSGRRFTQEDIPVGSIIELDAGYKYRPDGWKDDGKQALPRVLEVEKASVNVDAAWWGDFKYRTFNISTVNDAAGNKADISQRLEEVKDKVRVYVPRNVYAVETQIVDSTADITFMKLMESEGTDVFVIAAYDGNRLVQIECIEKEELIYAETIYHMANIAPGYTVKAFVLDNFENMKPISIQE